MQWNRAYCSQGSPPNYSYCIYIANGYQQSKQTVPSQWLLSKCANCNLYIRATGYYPNSAIPVNCITANGYCPNAAISVNCNLYITANGYCQNAAIPVNCNLYITANGYCPNAAIPVNYNLSTNAAILMKSTAHKSEDLKYTVLPPPFPMIQATPSPTII